MTWVGVRAATPLPAGVARVIEFAGLEIPLLVMPKNHMRVVLGSRRAAAVRSMGHYEQVPVYVPRTGQQLALWLDVDRRLEQATGTPGMPWSWQQRAEVLDAAIRGLGRERGGGGSTGSVAAYLAGYFDVHEVQLRNAMYLWRFARMETPTSAGRATADRANGWLALVEAGKILPQSAYRKLRAGDPVRVGSSQPRPGAAAEQQVKVLKATGETLAGITYGLRGLGDIAPEMTREQRAELVGPLLDARRVLTRLARQLQGGAADDTNEGDDT